MAVNGERALEYPPGPRSRIPGRTQLAFFLDPPGFLQRLSRYGGLAHFRFGSQDVYLITDPEEVQRALATYPRAFVKGQAMQASRRILGDGLLTSEGELHHTRRRLIQPAFHPQRVEAYAQTMVELAEEVASTWRDGERRDIDREMSLLTVRIVAKTLFSADLGREAVEIVDALDHAISNIGRVNLPGGALWERLPFPSSLRFRRAMARLDRAVVDIVAARQPANGDAPGDVFSRLHAAGEDESSAPRMRDEVLTLLLTGHETTANLLTWTWYQLSRHPQVEAKLHEELDRVLGARTPTLADLPALTYTGQIVHEALRLYPPAWAIPRQTIRDYEVGGYTIPAGATVTLSQFVMNRNERYFPNPTSFRPERWTREMQEGLPRGVFFPFGGGPRQCPGDGFAWQEARLLLATLAQRWTMRYADRRAPRVHPAITLRPRGRVRMRLVARTPAVPARAKPRRDARARTAGRASSRAGIAPQRWTPRTAFRRTAEVVRKEGLGSLWFRTLGEVAYRRLLLLERPFAEPMAVVEPRLPVVFEGLGPGDADEYVRLRPEADPADVERRLASGHELCVVARLDGRVVQACWIAIERVRIDYLARELRLADGVAYIHELYTVPELRGKGLDRAQFTHMLRVFRDVDVQTLMATSQLESRTYKLFERIGFQRSAVVGYVGVGLLRRYFVRREPECMVLDARQPRGARSRLRPAGRSVAPPAV